MSLGISNRVKLGQRIGDSGRRKTEVVGGGPGHQALVGQGIEAPSGACCYRGSGTGVYRAAGDVQHPEIL